MKLVPTWIFISALLSGGVHGAEPPSIEQVLSRHNDTIERLKRYAVTTEERWMMSRADATPEQILSIRRCDIRRDHARANLLVFETSFPPGILPDQAGQQGYANEFNYVCSDQVLEIYYPREEYSVRPRIPAAVRGRLAPEKVDEYFIQNAIGNAAIAFGLCTFGGPIPIKQLVLLGKNEPVKQDERGYRIEGTAVDGTRHKIWFDPDASYVVRGLKLEQSGATLNDNRYQYNRRVLESRFGFSGKALVETVTFEVRNVQVEPWKDTHVVTSLEMIKTIRANDGTKAIERTTHSLTGWNLDPDFSDPTSFQPRLRVPEGARVVVDDPPSIEYVYKNGTIQLAIHEKTVRSLERAQIPQRSAPPRVQWIWALLAGVFGVAWWRLRVQVN